MSKIEDINWKISQLKRTIWEENDDPANESGLTFAAHNEMTRVLDAIHLLLQENCPQDINNFKITDKSMGEISFSWYGDLFELDIDITDVGKTNFLICKPGADREDWVSADEASIEQIVNAMRDHF